MKAGVGGAEKAWDAPDWLERPSFGNVGACRFDADVFTDRFFMLRIFLFGESARSAAGTMGNECEQWSLRSGSPIIPQPGMELVLKFLNDVRGSDESGDSGGD